MKKCIGFILLVLLPIIVYADSVWTGNAAVGGISEFPGSSDVYRAASNSFPTGTVLEVTNPKGGAHTFVTVIGRLDSPGVFLLIEEEAAELIGLPSDHVLPVRVRPVPNYVDVTVEDTVDATLNDDVVTDDSDYNPTAGLEEGPLEPRTAVVEDLELAEEEILEASETIEEAVNDDIFVTPVPEYIEDECVDGDESEKIESLDIAGDEIVTELVIPEEIPEKEAEPVTIFTYVLDDEEPVDIEKDEESDELFFSESPEETENTLDIEEEENGSTVYFLTPSDFRPPPLVNSAGYDIADETIPDTDNFDEGTPTVEMVHETEREDTEISMAQEGLPYIQIGAYKNRAILEETARRVRSSGMYYPMSLATAERSGTPVYKLLIGPLRPAERGVVLQSLKSTAYPDAFPYSP